MGFFYFKLSVMQQNTSLSFFMHRWQFKIICKGETYV
nr:MAG TPA: hypothetical protein [Caudoviricetes sp.]